MNPTLEDVFMQPVCPGGFSFMTLPGAGNPSLSHKSWVTGYPQIPQHRIQHCLNPDWDTLNQFLGAETDLDRFLLSQQVNPPNNTSEWLQTEGDTVRAFYTHISHPVQLAFHLNGLPFVVQRSESGPLGPTQVSQTIDFNWGHNERSAMIGELKRHGIIHPGRWTGRNQVDSNRVWLGKELRAYCHKYKCFVASVFDGKHLLILIFNTANFNELRNENCPVWCLIFPHDSPILRYGLFRAASFQLQKMQAGLAPRVTLDGYVRRFRNGYRPYWVYQNTEYPFHPLGYVCMFDRENGAWYWAAADGTPALDENGQTVWDTWGLWQ